MQLVTEDNITELAVERWSTARDPRTAEVMTALVRHLHDFAREIAQHSPIHDRFDRDLDLDDSSASGLALDLDLPSERFDSIPEPGQSRPPPRIGSADAVIANRKEKHVVLDTEGDPHARGVRVL